MALGGVLLGLAARYALPGRSTHGSVLVPAIGTGVAALAWVSLTWLGLGWDSGWIWLLSFLLSATAAVLADVLLVRRRTRGDVLLLHTLVKAGAPAA